MARYVSDTEAEEEEEEEMTMRDTQMQPFLEFPVLLFVSALAPYTLPYTLHPTPYTLYYCS